ncbi:MAG: glycosidase, partial [Planctomycetota bacterium]
MPELMRQERAYDLFERYQGNPIMTAENWPYATNAVFNPAAAKLNNETLLLVRVED